MGIAWLSGMGHAQNRHDDELENYLRLALPQHLFAYASFEIASQENIAVGPDGSLALGIIQGQHKVNGGLRAELSIDYPFLPDDLVTYRWRFRVPSDFESDAPENRWVLVGQWHDQPDTSQGQTWDEFKSTSPPIAIGMGGIGPNELGLVFMYGITSDGDAQQMTQPIVFKRDKWNDVSVTVHWSQQQDGRAIFALNGKQIANMHGTNMNNAAAHYLKLGLYRHPDISGNHWISLSDIAIHHP